MKDRKKGFTLIEMLMVIAVMGFIGVIVTVSLTHTLQDTNQMKCDDFVLEIEEAACVYTSLSNKEVKCTREDCAPIPLSILVSEGQIKSETDACTGGELNLDATISVSWDATGEKKCVYNGVKEYAK